MDHVGIGMLGSGFIGELHMLGLRHVPEAFVIAAYRADAGRRKVSARRFGSQPLDSVDGVCADPDVDGPIRDELRRRVQTTSFDEVEIVIAELGTWAGAIGAAIHGAEVADEKDADAARASVGAR